MNKEMQINIDKIIDDLYTPDQLKNMQLDHKKYVSNISRALIVEDILDDSALARALIFKQHRLFGIGGSDLAQLFAIDNYGAKTSFDLFRDKRDWFGAPTINKLGSPADIGHRREPEIAKLYSEITGNKTRQSHKGYFHKRLPWMMANVDFAIQNFSDKTKGLECKTTGHWAAKKSDWGPGNEYDDYGKAALVKTCDQVPRRALLQVNHYMLVRNKPRWDLAAMIDSADFRIYTIEHSINLITAIIKSATTFWFNHVIPNIEPLPQTIKNFEQAYVKDTGKCVYASPKAVEVHNELCKIKDQIEALELKAYGPKKGDKRLGGLDLVARAELGDNSTLLSIRGTEMATYKHAKNSKKLNAKKMQMMEPEICEKYMVDTKGSRRFLFKRVEI